MWHEICEVCSPNSEGETAQCKNNCKECNEHKNYIKRKNRKLLVWLIISFITLNTVGALFNSAMPIPNFAFWMCGFMSGGFVGVYWIERLEGEN